RRRVWGSALRLGAPCPSSRVGGIAVNAPNGENVFTICLERRCLGVIRANRSWGRSRLSMGVVRVAGERTGRTDPWRAGGGRDTPPPMAPLLAAFAAKVLGALVAL